MDQKLYGGVELGGTKTICAIADVNGVITSQITIPTTTIDETFVAVFDFFENNAPISSMGVGAFGPLQVHPALPDFGYIYNAPKPGWSKVDLKDMFEEKIKVPVTLDTDVNCAAFGEKHYGVAKHTNNFIYLTLGTGIGGSLVMDSKIIHGILNLEMGHMRVPHEPFPGSYKGSCKFHGDCLEGIASGYAMADRYNKKPEENTDNKAWNNEAVYIASAVNNLMLTFGPELIVLGGGLTKHESLIPSIRNEVKQNINNYLDFPDLDQYIVGSSSDMNGVLGAIKLTSMAN